MVRVWSPKTTFLRTVLSGLAGYALAWAAIDWTTNWKAGATAIALNTATVVVAGAVAVIVAVKGHAASTPLGKGVYQVAQLTSAALLAFTFNTFADFTTFGRLLATTIPGAVLSGLGTWTQNALESDDLSKVL